MSDLSDALSAAKSRTIAELASERPVDGSRRRLAMRRVMQQAAYDFTESWRRSLGREYSELLDDDGKEMWRYITECVDAALAAWGYVEGDEMEGTTCSD